MHIIQSTKQLIKSINTITTTKNHKSFFKAIIIFIIITIIIVLLITLSPSFSNTNKTARIMPIPNSSNTPIKSVRIDLSSMNIPENQTEFRQQIISQLISVGANTVYINPWSDGYANYQSNLAQQNRLGQQKFFEDFITLAHSADLKVFAWFVVGKDNFPANTHPEWYARTIQDKSYMQEDEPGINLPFASLVNEQYLTYHLNLISEVNLLPIDGWVISEPLIGWGDKYDSDYTDFSSPALKLYQQQGISNPKQIIKNARDANPSNQSLYQQLTNVRANIVTNFVSKTMQRIRQEKPKPIIITVFTEPDKQGNLISFDQIKEWLGTDIDKLASLNPDIIEIQSLFLDFEYSQPPAWTASMIKQFKQQLNLDIPIAVSIQGFDSEEQPLAPTDFTTAMSAALNQSVAGTSFYAYHTLEPEHWRQLTSLWKTTKP